MDECDLSGCFGGFGAAHFGGTSVFEQIGGIEKETIARVFETVSLGNRIKLGD